MNSPAPKNAPEMQRLAIGSSFQSGAGKDPSSPIWIVAPPALFSVSPFADSPFTPALSSDTLPSLEGTLDPGAETLLFSSEAATLLKAGRAAVELLCLSSVVVAFFLPHPKKPDPPLPPPSERVEPELPPPVV